MEFNGTNANKLKLFENINLDELPDEIDETVNVNNSADIKLSNCISELPNRFANTTFNDISVELASKVKPFALKQKNDEIFLLFGQIGLGKTSAMAAAIHERQLKGLDCGLYFSIRFLLPRLRTCRSFSAKENEEAFYRRLSTASFLCLDEVGTCADKNEEREFLTTVISARYDNMLPTFISTNLSPNKFKYLITGNDYSDRTVEEQVVLCKDLDKTDPVLNRIKSVAIPYAITGESYRKRG